MSDDDRPRAGESVRAAEAILDKLATIEALLRELLAEVKRSGIRDMDRLGH